MKCENGEQKKYLNDKLRDITKEIAAKIKENLSRRGDSSQEKNVTTYIESFILDDDELSDLTGEEVKFMVDRIELAINSDVSILEKYISDREISEIMVNGWNEIFIEKNGEIIKVEDEFFDEEELGEVIRRIGSSVNREINERVPILDARLHDGSRVNAIYKNITDGRYILTIRKFMMKDVTMSDLMENGTLTQECVDFLETIINRGYNIFVSGGTSSGKTTMLNAILKGIPRDERVVIIEDSRELARGDLENVVQLECKEKSGYDDDEVSTDKLIKASLRMRPDRIVIGEIRDGKALVNMLNGLNTGHTGLCTGHSNSVEGMIRRMESLYMQESSFPIESIDEQIAQGVDIIVHLERLGNGDRRVVEVSELFIGERGRIDINPIFIVEKDILRRTDNTIIKSKGFDENEND